MKCSDTLAFPEVDISPKHGTFIKTERLTSVNFLFQGTTLQLVITSP